MATWEHFSKLSGYYISPDFAISLDGDGAISTISWDSLLPQGTSIKVETNISFNGGYDWNGWKVASNGGSIPDIKSNTSMKNAVLKYRVTEKTIDKNITPTLQSVYFYFEPIIHYDNKGDINLRPEIWITKIGNGDLSIINTTKGNEEFKFTGLLDQETVYVNGDREQIETSLAATYRYENFNDNYLELLPGVNVLRVIGNANIKFRHQFKLLQG
jgi:hypothetical protein